MQAQYWHRVLSRQGPERSSWFSQHPKTSLDLIGRYAPRGRSDAIVDVGGGASTLAEHLLRASYTKVTVADFAPASLSWTHKRLAAAADRYSWVCADVTTADLGGPFRLWHDRACLHFLTQDAEVRAYVESLRRHLIVSGHAVVGAYSVEGPARASGLPVRHYTPAAFKQLFGPHFELVHSQLDTHATQAGRVEPYVYAVLRRLR